MTERNAARARRPLTDSELAQILAGIGAAGDTQQLLGQLLHSVYDALLADSGRSVDSLPEGARLDPQQFAIPSSQWHALMAAASNRASAWGTGAELFPDLVGMMPDSYDDCSVPAPELDLPDYRPPVHDLHVSREATDVIVACCAHVAALESFYGADAPAARRAAASWLQLLTALFRMTFGADTEVQPAGPLSLTVHTGSGFIYGIVFHGDRRHCRRCDAELDDDGTAHTAGREPAVEEHKHVPSYPYDAPQPGSWSAHS